MKFWLAVFLTLGVAACSGGGGHAVPVASSAPGGTTQSTTSLKITVPKATAATSAQKRTPAFVSSATQSISLDIEMQGGTASLSGYPVTENLTSTSPGCSTTQTGTVCVEALALTPGKYDATLSTFDGLNGTGNLLSSAQSVPFTVVLNQANTVSLVLGGIATSMEIVAGANAIAGHLSTITVPANGTGALNVYGLDVDGDTIVGPGGPTITATTSDATQLTVTPPGPTAPNAVDVTTLSSTAIARVTATITPGTGDGGSPMSQTVLVQAPAVPLLYIASNEGHIFDMTGTEITPAGSAFTTAFSGPGGEGLAYNTSNGFIYASNQGPSTSSLFAFDPNGNAEALNATDTTGLPVIGGIAFDPNNGYVYAAGESVAFDASGNAHALTSGLPFSYSVTWDPQHNVVVDRTDTYDANGNQINNLNFSGQVNAIAYNAFNGFIYVATVYPTAVTVYDTSGNLQSVPGTFINGSGEQIGGIIADPVTGNVFLATNAEKTHGFDHNGNALPLPWHDIVGVGAASGDAGLLLLTP